MRGRFVRLEDIGCALSRTMEPLRSQIPIEFMPRKGLNKLYCSTTTKSEPPSRDGINYLCANLMRSNMGECEMNGCLSNERSASNICRPTPVSGVLSINEIPSS
jgi:hypothetical protein